MGNSHFKEICFAKHCFTSCTSLTPTEISVKKILIQFLEKDLNLLLNF